MEFIGRVSRVLPLRSGTSHKGEWKALPFIFEYFENKTDRYADSVLLETFDARVIDNMKEGMEVRCGFGHRTREYQGKVYNEVRLYKIESIKKAQQTDGGVSAAAMSQHRETAAADPAASAKQQDGTVGQNENDLPF